MKMYEVPETEIIKFSAEDVVVTSDPIDTTEETEDTSGRGGADF